MQIESLESFPPNENPFHHDAIRMGSRIGKNITVMFSKFDNEIQNYIIVIDTVTGERIRINFDSGEKNA